MNKLDLDKKKILSSFNRAAKTYDQAAHLQRIVGEKLLSFLAEIKKPLKTILDLGCGTGVISAHLKKIYPDSSIFALDLAENMVRLAQNKIAKEKLHWVVGDADFLPIKNNMLDLIVSNLMLQWINKLPNTLSQIHYALSKEGHFLCTTFAPGSLIEFLNASQSVDSQPRIHPFLSKNELKKIFHEANFKICHWEQDEYIEYYPDILAIMKKLKMLGATNAQTNRPNFLQTRNHFKKLAEAYEKFRTKTGLLPCTWQIYFFVLVK